MPRAPEHKNEAARLDALRQCGVLDTANEPSLDDLVGLAAMLCGTPMALISLVDANRQWFKASVGVDVKETHRDQSFCAHAILSDGPMIVRDTTQDPRTMDNRQVTGPPYFRFYAGVPLLSREGLGLGTLCVVDTVTRDLTAQQIDVLRRLALQVQTQLDLRRDFLALARRKRRVEQSLGKATATLTAERERLELVLAGSGLGSWEWNPQTGEARFDERWLALLGMGSLPGRVEEWSHRIHADDLPLVKAELARHCAGETPRYECACRVMHADGAWRWMLGRGIVVARDSAGNPVRMIGTTEDITARKRAQAEQAAALVTATALARANTVTEAANAVCSALEEGTGLSRTGVLLFNGDDICDYVGWRGISEEYRRAVRGHCPWPLHARDAHPIIIDNTATAPGFVGYTELFRREKIGSLAFIPINTQAGVVGKLMLYGEAPGSIRDCHVRAASAIALSLGTTVGRLRMATALAESERRYRAMIEGTDVVVWEFDLAANAFTFVSPQAERMGYALAEWYGPNFWDEHLHPDDRERAATFCLSEAAAGRNHRCQYRMLRADGVARWIDDYVSVERDPSGKTTLRGVMVDITERKRDEAALVEAQARADAANLAKSEFLANMSHEIRTPMTAILGFTDLIGEEGEYANDPQQRREAITTIRRNGEHLLAIINDILDISKVEAGKMTANLVTTSPGTIVADILSLMSIKAQAKCLTLDAGYDTPIPALISTDPVRLRQILVNLVGNAIKFTDIGGVTIRMAFNPGAGEHLRFDIADTGIGIDPAHHTRIFGAFAQGDASTSRRYGGTGLGLHISKRLAGMLGGDITVASTKGRGSVFSLTIATGPLTGIPMVTPDAPITGPSAAAPLARTADSARQPLRGVRVLVAEDGADNRRLIEFYLRRAGAQVLPVNDGRTMIAALTGDTPEAPLLHPCPVDLVVTDMQMPEMDGYAAVRQLRAKGCRTPIIALTAHSMSDDRARCLDAGCDHYLPKPIDRAAFIDLCASAASAGRHAAKAAA